ncbi:MAG: type II secretion system protein GspN [Desulfuromonadales bacterium]|nr:type II secretion system protein GspN [Desulfuromonadales bacterium]
MKPSWPQFTRRKNGRKTFIGRFGHHLLALLILLLAVLCGFFLFFPDRALQQRFEQELSVQLGAPVNTESVILSFPGYLQIHHLTVSGKTLPFTIDTLQLSPVWTTLLSARPGLNFTLTSGGGTIAGQIDSSRRLHAEIAALPVTVPLPGMAPLTLGGTLTGSLLDMLLAVTPDSATRAELTIDDLILTGLEQLTGKPDPLVLGRLSIGIKGTENNYRVEQLQLAGGAITADGVMTVTPLSPPAASRLNGNLTLHPTDQLPPELATLLPLLGKANRNGDYRLRLTGSVASPRLH